MLPSVFKKTGYLPGPSMDDLIERLFYGWPAFEHSSTASWMPRIDVHESDKEIHIEVELAGIDKKDVKVEVKNNVLTISGERALTRKSDDKNFSRIERHYGKFERSFSLPETVNSEKLTAIFNNSVLTVAAPKTEKAITKQIEVAVK